MTVAVRSIPFPDWLESILRLLPRSRSVARMPDPPDEIRPLVSIGRDTLAARDLGDLHARLDGYVMQLRNIRIPARRAEPADHLPDFADIPEHVAEDSPVARALGLNVAGKFLTALQETVALLPSIGAALNEAQTTRGAFAVRALAVRPWSLHDGDVVPHAFIESAIVQGRGVVALGALIAACVDTRKPEPWVTSALADELLKAVRELARLLASAGYDVGPRKPTNLIDLEAVFREAEEADMAFLAAFESDVNSGREGMPEDM